MASHRAIVFVVAIGISCIFGSNGVLAATNPEEAPGVKTSDSHAVQHLSTSGSYPLPLNSNLQPSGPYNPQNPQPTGRYMSQLLPNGQYMPQPGTNGQYMPQPGSNGQYMPQPGPNGQYMPQPGPNGQYMPQRGPYGPYMPQATPYGTYMHQPAPYNPYMPQPSYGQFMMLPSPMYPRPGGKAPQKPGKQNAISASHTLSALNGQAFNNMEFEFGK